ncbi:hypothetical protein BHL83_09770 [Limosilactobacillus reuteri]|uniref:Uncharacterized protein n=1 Tax=Limosilactobacillus reuteri TaxID=1598 RepID=A0A1Y2UF34_LIMRT|nr:hypothetical protein [Limosilactobacillus reuteri]OTA48242.1 hypothetical protein BHL91_09360 [Limosilactobacillus reuteri]OTA54065.1 hypothetical protein BHL85_10290 [Limosilactobacillus reuteri]OTA76395.1 hypothetical protein BHL81_08705 [Limosilactobacillus reuteri]OTA81249.1 hypothetical protein BHL83_09770 [Limosilactobacillus reuteri]OTA81264.1 hypothetical protein BHL82_10065 [Limosilactobacillus reuteri]
MDFISSALDTKDRNGVYPFSNVFVDEELTFGNNFPHDWHIVKQANVKERVAGHNTGKQITRVMAYPENTYQQLAKLNLLATLESIPATPIFVHDNLSAQDVTEHVLSLKKGKYKIGFQHTSQARGIDVTWAFNKFQLDVDSDGYDIK